MPKAPRSFVMPEDEWLKLCAAQCRARQKEFGDDPDYCEEHSGLCPECVADAADVVPDHYRTTRAIAAAHDTLPGL